MTETMLTGKVKTRKTFKELFPIDVGVKNAIKENMELSGFDESQPIIIWKDICIDGHTRLAAAQEAGLKKIPVFRHDFESDDKALEYAIHNQSNRRNLTPADIIRCVEALDKRKHWGGDRKTEKIKASGDALKSATDTAKTIGTSQSTVERARTIIDHADDETKKDVKDGKKSIHQAYTETQEKRRLETTSTFNKTNENIEWAKWSWNPVTGCKHDCQYCYAHDLATRFNKNGFEPTFHDNRLSAPLNTKVPGLASTDIGFKNVFVCSMADLFGDWVPQEWIDKVMKTVNDNLQWNFLFLTKSPKRLLGIEFPDNAWVGTTVDVQSRVHDAEEVFKNLKAKVKFLSCEPLKERLTFKSLEMFDWVIIGGQRQAYKESAFQPQWEWVEHLVTQARKAKCKIYFKPNLETRPKEYPKKGEG